MEEKGEVLFKESFFASFQSQTSLKEVENEDDAFWDPFLKAFQTTLWQVVVAGL